MDGLNRAERPTWEDAYCLPKAALLGVHSSAQEIVETRLFVVRNLLCCLQQVATTLFGRRRRIDITSRIISPRLFWEWYVAERDYGPGMA